VSGAPSAVTTTLTPEQVTLPPDGSATSTLTVSVDTTATPGSYTLTVTGTSATLAHSVDISLEIATVPPPSEWSFAIITDLHIGRGYPDYGGKGIGPEDWQVEGQEYYLTERLRNVVKWINDYKTEYGIKFVVVLGDISDSGERSELLKAKNILDTLAIPYIPIIGNHDVWPYTEEEENESIGYFESVFKGQLEELAKDTSLNLRKQAGPNPSDLQNYAFSYKGIKFIILDVVSRTGAPGKGVLPNAALWDSSLYWLTENLHPNEPTIILSHHPLINHISAFPLIKDVYDIDEAITISKANVLANFAGHIHGFEEFLGAPLFVDANKDYREKGYFTPANIPVVTTEALMVGSNEPTPKCIIRIIKVVGIGIKDYNIFEGEFRSLNPYLKVYEEWPPFGKIAITFEAYAFTRRFTEQTPGRYAMNFGDGTRIEWSKEVTSWVEKVYFYHDFEGGKEYNLTLFATGWTPEGEPIVEKIEQKISVPPPYTLGILGLSPIDIAVTAPDGLIINKQINEIPGATYVETDFNGDGEADDIILIPDRKMGDYLISVIPEPDAAPTDKYTLEVWTEGITVVLAADVPISDIPPQPYAIASTEMETIPIFVWNYVFTDSYGRGTTLKINTAYKFFQFITPDKDYGIREATYMRVHGRTITMRHEDNQLRLITLTVDTKLDFCVAIAWDKQTRKQYFLIDKPGIEK
jgi:hypothetical protein